MNAKQTTILGFGLMIIALMGFIDPGLTMLIVFCTGILLIQDGNHMVKK